MPSSKIAATSYARLREQVRRTFLLGQQKIEEEKVKTYWRTGRLIHQHILENRDRAEYGRQVILRLSEDLEVSESVLRRTVQFYQAFSISATSRKLTWAHYCELLPIKEEQTRLGLTERAARQEWTIDELRRKIRDEIWKEDGRLQLEDQRKSPPTPLKPKRGILYTYQLIQPDQVSGEKPYVLADLGFASYRRLYKTDLKPGEIVESVWNEARGDYKISKSKHEAAALFTYKALVEHVVDGDTLRVKVDLGFDIWTRQYLRLRGIDCPEIDTEKGKKAKRFVEKQLENAPSILLTSSRSDKYDRYLADVFIGDQYLNQQLLDQNLAVRVRE